MAENSRLKLARARARARQRSSNTEQSGATPERMGLGGDDAPPEVGSEQWYTDQDMPGYGMPFSDEVKRSAIQSGGALAGTLLSGGQPLGGAAGYALANQLLEKYKDGKDITPSGAGKDLAVGAAMEYLPKGVLKLGDKGLEAASKSLYHKAIKPTGTMINTDAARKRTQEAIEFGRKNRMLLTENTRDKNAAIVDKLVSKVDGLVKGSGAQIKSQDVLKALQKDIDEAALDGFDKISLQKKIMRHIEKFYKAHGDTLSPEKAHSMKKLYNKKLDKDYDQTRKAFKTNLMKSLNRGLKEEIEKVAPGVKDLNSEMSNRIRLNNMMTKRMTGQENRAVVDLNDIVMAKIAGPLGVLGRRGATSPNMMAATGIGAADLAKLMKAGVDGIPPAAVTNLLLNQAVGRHER